MIDIGKNISFYQPYLIVGTNRVGIFGTRIGVKAEAADIFLNKSPDIITDPSFLKTKVTGNVIPFIIFDMGATSF